MYWTLSKLGREFYVVEIVTSPQLDDWEISFDQGATWHAMEYDQPNNSARILVSGPEFQVPSGDTTTFTRLASSVTPYIRAIDNPEVIVRTTPRIDLV